MIKDKRHDHQHDLYEYEQIIKICVTILLLLKWKANPHEFQRTCDVGLQRVSKAVMENLPLITYQGES